MSRKLGTKGAIKKRFHITSTGKVMAKKAGKRHNLSAQSNKSLRQKTPFHALSTRGKSFLKNMIEGLR